MLTLAPSGKGSVLGCDCQHLRLGWRDGEGAASQVQVLHDIHGADGCMAQRVADTHSKSESKSVGSWD